MNGIALMCEGMRGRLSQKNSEYTVKMKVHPIRFVSYAIMCNSPRIDSQIGKLSCSQCVYYQTQWERDSKSREILEY